MLTSPPPLIFPTNSITNNQLVYPLDFCRSFSEKFHPSFFKTCPRLQFNFFRPLTHRVVKIMAGPPGLSETEPGNKKKCLDLIIKSSVTDTQPPSAASKNKSHLCFHGLVTASSPGVVATPVSGSRVAFVAFSLRITAFLVIGQKCHVSF